MMASRVMAAGASPSADLGRRPARRGGSVGSRVDMPKGKPQLLVDPIEQAWHLGAGQDGAHHLAAHDATRSSTAHHPLDRAAGCRDVSRLELPPDLFGVADLHAGSPTDGVPGASYKSAQQLCGGRSVRRRNLHDLRGCSNSARAKNALAAFGNQARRGQVPAKALVLLGLAHPALLGLDHATDNFGYLGSWSRSTCPGRCCSGTAVLRCPQGTGRNAGSSTGLSSQRHEVVDASAARRQSARRLATSLKTARATATTFSDVSRTSPSQNAIDRPRRTHRASTVRSDRAAS